MDANQKKGIQEKLNEYISGFPNTSAAAASLNGVSHATLIHIRDGKWTNISDDMWRNVGLQVMPKKRKGVIPVETRDFKIMTYYFNLSKEEGAAFSIIGGSGYGKSFTGTWFRDNNRKRNVYYLECAEYWTPKHFMIELVQEMGKEARGSVYDMMATVIKEMRKKDKPLLIVDEVDKLDDKTLRFFITLYNKLAGMCGLTWTATNNIERRIKRGLRLGKTGYEELYSRIGRTHIELMGTNQEEVAAICASMGITNIEEINRLFNEYCGDLRRVDRVILKNKVKKTA